MDVIEPCLCSRLRRASRSLTRLYDEALQPVGLTVTQFGVMRTLSRLEGPTLAGLAEATAHEKSGLWRTLQPLIRRGWVEAANEGRVQRLKLTEDGMVRVLRALPRWREAQSRVEGALGPRGRMLAELLEVAEGIG